MWEPYHPITYFGHVIAGIIGLAAAVVALSTKKGSSVHIAAGRIFAVTMMVAVVTTLVFLLDRARQPLIIVLATGAFYLVSSGILAVRNERRYAKILERVLMAIPFLIFLFSLLRIFQGLAGSPTQIPGPLIFAGIFGGLLLGDIRVMRSRPTEWVAWVRRHLLRMLLAFGFATMALLRLGLDLGLPLFVTVVVPLIFAFLLSVYFNRRVSQAMLDGDQASLAGDAS